MIIKTIKLHEGRDDVTLTTYVIAEKGELNAVGKRPAVLICPGGAYLGCSDREAEPVALKFAAMGYHAFVLRYSTYSEGCGFPGFDKPLAEKKHCQHPAPMRDIGKAMLTLREHSDEWFVDMERVAVCGFSAGAHNAAMFGVYWNQPIMTDFLETSNEAIRPAAIIFGYGLSDYLQMRESNQNDNAPAMAQNLANAANMAFLGSTAPDEELLTAVSPARLITKHMPPTFIWATADDFIVPVKQSTVLANALAEQGIPFEMHIFEKGIHGLSIATQASSVDISQMNADAAKWIDLAECWLNKRFALHLPEPPAYHGEG
jgi:acetyl esterase/lipase